MGLTAFAYSNIFAHGRLDLLGRPGEMCDYCEELS